MQLIYISNNYLIDFISNKIFVVVIFLVNKFPSQIIIFVFEFPINLGYFCIDDPLSTRDFKSGHLTGFSKLLAFKRFRLLSLLY